MFKKIDKEQIDAWVERAYANAKRHGWHEKEKSDKHWLINIINFRCSSFTENAFKISNMIFEDEILDDNLRETFLSSTLRYMFQWAEAVGVNLQQQIELKMRYNESREYMHGGKKY